MMNRATIAIIIALTTLTGCARQNNQQLFDDIENGNLDAVKAAIRAGAASNSKDRLGRPPLTVAITSGQPEMVDIILKGEGDSNVDFQGIPQISIAVTQIPCNARIIQTLVKHGADVDSVDEVTGSSVLMSAASLGNEACVRELIARGADRTTLNKRGEGLVATATLSGDANFVAEILSEMVNFDSSSSDARLALRYATMARNKQIVTLLRDRGVEP